LGRCQLDRFNNAGKRFNDGIHHRRMEGVGGMQMTTGDILRF
jgi:hypothetical protein